MRMWIAFKLTERVVKVVLERTAAYDVYNSTYPQLCGNGSARQVSSYLTNLGYVKTGRSGVGSLAIETWEKA